MAQMNSDGSQPAARRGLHFAKNALLFFASLIFSLVVAEGVVRYIDGYSMIGIPLGTPSGFAPVNAAVIDRLPMPAGAERDWFFTDPEPLPNRRPVPKEWEQRFRAIEANPAASGKFMPSDAFKAWNSVYAGDPCKHRLLRYGPNELFVYDPADGAARPPFRFLPDATFPDGMVTNQIGWRGRPVEEPRGDKTVRIVFIGASTVVDSHYSPFSWPELAGHWLNMWAKAKGLAVRFEVLNAGREGPISPDLAAIVRTEILPLRPDLVVYYEGGNQFRLASLVDTMPKGSPVRPATVNALPSWLLTAARYSAVMARVKAAVGAIESDPSGGEWPKPDYKLVWPVGLDEFDPDLSHPDLPINLNIIQRDLDHIRADLATVGSDFALSSFAWFVKDGMTLDPVRHRYTLEQLNVALYPFRYRDIERLAKFQNNLLAKYAKVHSVPFVDIAGRTPFDPDLFLDAVHSSYAGSRVRGWITFTELLPIIEKHLADRSWPRPWPTDAPPLPTFKTRRIAVECGQ